MAEVYEDIGKNTICNSNLSSPSESYQYTVQESLPVASVVAKIKAVDADIGTNAEMDYKITDGDGPGLFKITTDEDTQEGVILLLRVQTPSPSTGVTPPL